MIVFIVKELCYFSTNINAWGIPSWARAFPNVWNISNMLYWRWRWWWRYHHRSLYKHQRQSFPSHFGRTRRSEVDIIARHVIRKKGARDNEGLREWQNNHRDSTAPLLLKCGASKHFMTKKWKVNLIGSRILTYNWNMLGTLPSGSCWRGGWISMIWCYPLSFLNLSTNIILLLPDL